MLIQKEVLDTFVVAKNEKSLTKFKLTVTDTVL